MADAEFTGQTMSEEQYLNMVFSRLEEAQQAHGGAHVLRLRTKAAQGPGISEEVTAQRRAVGELAARLLEGIRDEALALAFTEYQIYLKAKG